MDIKYKKEIWRKSVHLSGVFLIPLLYWNKHAAALALLGSLILYGLIELGMHNKIKIPFLTRLTLLSKRQNEKGRLSLGPPFMVFSGILAIYLFEPKAAAVGLAQLCVADAFACLVGMKFGKTKLPHSSNKTWVGSFGFFLVAIGVSLAFVSFQKAVGLALVGTLLESLPMDDFDNFTIPLGVAGMAQLLN